MMNTTINGNSNYKDFLIMDCYGGSDVGGAVAIGVDRQAMNAFIMGSDAARTSWSRSAQLITSFNIGSQSVNYASSANYANSAGNSDTTDGLHVASGRNNSANQIVRTDGNGYIQCGYINSSSGDEKNASNPSYVWGTNGSDSYLRTYNTGYLSVNYANSAGYASSAGSAPASDVYSWAKQSSKPSYSYSEVGAAASSHSHSSVTYASYTADGTVGSAKLKNIYAGTSDMTAGSSSLSTGTIYLVYE